VTLALRKPAAGALRFWCEKVRVGRLRLTPLLARRDHESAIQISRRARGTIEILARPSAADVLRAGGAPFVLVSANQPPATAVDHNGPHFPLVRGGQCAEGTWPGDNARIRHLRKDRVPSPGPLVPTTMPRHDIIVAGIVGLAVLASTPACATDVAGVSCSDIGRFARLVAEQKAKGSHSTKRFATCAGPLAPNTRTPSMSRKDGSSDLSDADLFHRQPGRGLQRIPDRL